MLELREEGRLVVGSMGEERDDMPGKVAESILAIKTGGAAV